MRNQFAAKVMAELPAPGDDPVSHLRHTVAAFADEDPDKMVVLATMGVYPDHGQTGLTWGDLRALLAMVESREAEIKQAYLDGANRADAQWTLAAMQLAKLAD